MALEETLFQFSLLRPAVQQDPKLPNIQLTQATEFQKKLGLAVVSAKPRDNIVLAAKELIADRSRFVVDPSGTPFSAKVIAFGRAVDNITSDAGIDKAKVIQAVQDAFGSAPAQVVATDDYKNFLSNLRDSVLAIKYVQEEHSRPIETLTDEIRDLELIAQVANPTLDKDTDPKAKLNLFRKRPVLLPGSADLKSILSNADGDAAAAKNNRTRFTDDFKRTHDLILQHGRLSQAIKDLSTVDVSHFQATALSDHAGIALDDDLAGHALQASQVRFTNELQKVNLLQLGDKPTVPVTIPSGGGVQGPIVVRPPITINPPIDVRTTPADTSTNPNVANLTSEKITTEALQLPLSVNSESISLADTKSLLDANNVKLELQPVNGVLKNFHGQLTDTTQALLDLSPVSEQVSLHNFGTSTVAIRTPIISDISRLVLAGDISRIGSLVNLLPPDGRIPHTKGNVMPAGVADLLVVKQTLKGYEAADIAHIENVLKGESKTSDQTRTHRTEQTDSSEQELTTEDDTEHDSISRFEMSKESSNVIKDDESLKAGLKATAKYGPVLEISASVEGALSRSKEESVKSASKFSQDVTDKAVKKITQRTLTKKTTVQFDETVTKEGHGIDNAKLGQANISGVYQFINKVYEAQVFNYGLRTMYDFMIPEPAAWIVGSLRKKAAQASMTTLVKPLPFGLQPFQLVDSTYQSWVSLYQATDVNPPPDYFVTKVDNVNKGGGGPKADYVHSGTISVPAGYEAVYASVSFVGTVWDTKKYLVDVNIGRAVHRFSATDSQQWGTNLSNEVGEIAWGVSTLLIENIAVVVEVQTRRTDRAYMTWQADTHAKLVNAFKAREQEYEEKLAALNIKSGVAITGTNPAANLQTVNAELKKNVISVLTDQHFDLFNSVTDLGWGPEINIFEAAGEGAYVRFFEQAFEWDQMSYVTYPYFWSTKSRWQDKQTFADPDPIFNEFLQAGFARVVVPARLGFEGAIDHFMTFGELWNGGPLPPISSNLYLPIASEIQERLNKPGDQIPQGAPWTVKVPTELIKLRQDDKLPKWHKDNTGAWVADAE
ncbi:hypothetical protein FH972_022179 [Carpinus fangiana]|uniref:Uncharacterized protein n=1 Tax=Carpinus fangiana TaxID=176857 RepID=A0A5N6KRH7_9ROSI|nr:hypothetical protein FH972_022179 [Carpinus fangiana]